uniref:Uncharacterized protein n=1 Tax=Paramoeba aestuarina TaxID=180227 RepID=A0A7S4NDQ9_9EUKA
MTLASTGELVDALLSVRPLLNDKDDLRVRVVTNTWQPLFGAFEEDYEKDQEKNPNAWKEVVSVTDTFLKTSTPTFVFSIKRLADHVVKDFATQPVFVTPGKGLNYFNNQVDNGSLHRYLTFATVFVVWREVTDEFKEFYTYFAKQGVVLMMLDNNIIDQYFSQRPYLASAPIAVICNRFVAGNIRQLKNYAPKAGVFVYTGNQSVNDAKNAFSGVFNYQTNDGVYTNPDDLKRQCLVSLESQ